MPKPPNGNCGAAPNYCAYPGNPAIGCEETCWPPGFYPIDHWNPCEEGPGICVWTVYLLYCQFIPPASRLCWYGYTLRYTDCAPVAPEEASYVNDIPRTILYGYNIIGQPAFFKVFMNEAEGVPVFRFANKDTPCNIKIKIDPTYFLP